MEGLLCRFQKLCRSVKCHIFLAKVSQSSGKRTFFFPQMGKERTSGSWPDLIMLLSIPDSWFPWTRSFKGVYTPPIPSGNVIVTCVSCKTHQFFLNTVWFCYFCWAFDNVSALKCHCINLLLCLGCQCQLQAPLEGCAFDWQGQDDWHRVSLLSKLKCITAWQSCSAQCHPSLVPAMLVHFSPLSETANNWNWCSMS